MDQVQEIEWVDRLHEDFLRQQEFKINEHKTQNIPSNPFLKLENFTRLRDLSLRYATERADRELHTLLGIRKNKTPWKTQDRLLVAIGSSPSSEGLIRWTHRQAMILNCPWTALYVDIGDSSLQEDKTRINQNLSLARELGAEALVLPGISLSESILDYAIQNSISQIVLGKNLKPHKVFWKKSLADLIIRKCGSIDVHVIRPAKEGDSLPLKPRSIAYPQTRLLEWTWVIIIPGTVTCMGWLLLKFIGPHSIALLYLTSVVLAGLRLSRWPVIGIAFMNALLWNYVFVPPYFAFAINEFHDSTTFSMLLLTAIVLGDLTTRIKRRERIEFLREKRTSLILAFTQCLTSQPEMTEAIRQALRMIKEILHFEVALFTRRNSTLLNSKETPGSTFEPDPQEHEIALWCYQNRKPAGKFTETFDFIESLILPLYTSSIQVGVLLIRPPQNYRLDFTERQLLENFATQLSLFLQKEHVFEAVHQAEVAERSSQLQKTLLDSVSHELKTPLAALNASSESLQSPATSNNPPQVRSFAQEIQSAVNRLNRIVNHLIESTRLESGAIQPLKEWVDPLEIVSDLKKQLRENFRNRSFEVDANSLPLIKTDSILLNKSLLNLLGNAMSYTPVDSAILLQLQVIDQKLKIQVTDHGPGIPPEDLDRIFDKFYRGKTTKTGGTGLGLSITRGFVKALGGEIQAQNIPTGGARFELTIPVETQMISPHMEDLS